MSLDPTAMPLVFDPQCFHNHLGPWAIEPGFGVTLLSALRAGSFEPKVQAAIPGTCSVARQMSAFAGLVAGRLSEDLRC